MNIYKHSDYKEILKSSLLHKKSSLGRGYTFEAFAQACHVQKTYISRVFNQHGDLSRDQLYRACQFLGFSANEKDYVFLTYDYQTTQISELKKKLLSEIDSIQNIQKLTESNISVETQNLNPEDLSRYYLDPYFSVIHMFLTIKKFSKEIHLIAQSIGISQDALLTYIEHLNRMKLIEYKKDQWIVLKDNLHLSKTSSLYKAYRSLMRLKSIEQMEHLTEEEFYSFSVVFSSDPEVRKKIKDEFLNFLKKTQNLVSQGKEQSVYQMNFDLFNWER